MGTAKSAIERLEVLFSDLAGKYRDDEWAMTNFSDSYVRTLNAGEAFEFLDLLAGRIDFQEDPSVQTEFLQVLLDSARHSGTTQVPPRLDANWERLAQTSEKGGSYAVGLFAEIAAYYRREA